MAESRRIAFVPPRFGDDMVGGAEAVVREAAEGLAGRGWEVEILTTCARSHFDWLNEYPPGRSTSGGLAVERFPIAHAPTSEARDRVERRIQLGERVSFEDQHVWVNGWRAPGLFHHLVATASTYRAIVFAPYLFWPTVACGAIAPERTVVMPCLHDETYAYLDVFRPVLSRPARVWFLSEPEHQLAHRLGLLSPGHTVTGAGVGVPEPAAYDPEGFRRRHGLERDFVLYAGRREAGKGWDDLLRGYAAGVERLSLPLDLVTFGVGKVEPPASIADRVVDLGFVADDEARNAFAAAAVSVQPSRNESFSRTLMEAWLAGTPVVATEEGAVVSWHCERSGGGLTYGDDFELARCLAWMAESPGEAARMAEAGRAYVLDNYRWDRVLDRMEESLEGLACVS